MNIRGNTIGKFTNVQKSTSVPPFLLDANEIEIIHRLFDVSNHRYVLSSQFKPDQSITQPPTLLAAWEGSLGAYRR